MKARAGAAVLVVGLALLVALGYAGSTTQKPHPSVYSTYDTGPNGFRALYEVLAKAGVPVRRFEGVLGTLDPSVRTLVITGYENDPEAKPLDEKDARWLRRFVERGGRLVAMDAEFAGSADVTPGVATTTRTYGGDAVALARNRYTAGVARVSGPIEWTFPFRGTLGVPLLANRQGLVAVLYPFGRGEVVAIAAPGLFGNAALRNAGNLRFAFNAVAGGANVAFDEYVHGYESGPNAWDALPPAVRVAAGIVVLAVVLGLVGANVPFAPPYAPPANDDRDSSDYVTALADLMHRSRARPSDAAVIQDAVLAYRMRKEHA